MSGTISRGSKWFVEESKCMLAVSNYSLVSDLNKLSDLL
jgi:hypothetical protein